MGFHMAKVTRRLGHKGILKKLRQHEVEYVFPELHHYFSEKFKASPPSLEDFCSYCGGRKLQSRGENRQTIRRVEAFVKKVEQDWPIERAKLYAWVEYPLMRDGKVTR